MVLPDLWWVVYPFTDAGNSQLPKSRLVSDARALGGKAPLIGLHGSPLIHSDLMAWNGGSWGLGPGSKRSRNPSVTSSGTDYLP